MLHFQKQKRETNTSYQNYQVRTSPSADITHADRAADGHLVDCRDRLAALNDFTHGPRGAAVQESQDQCTATVIREAPDRHNRARAYPDIPALHCACVMYRSFSARVHVDAPRRREGQAVDHPLLHCSTQSHCAEFTQVRPTTQCAACAQSQSHQRAV